MCSSSFAELPALNAGAYPLPESDERSNPWPSSIRRRVFDFCVAALALLCFSPLILLVAAAVRFSSPGPAFFRQRRMGRHRQEFTLYKFRSMMADNRQGSSITVRGDPRITRVGAILRRYKLDEVPQFWNVLKGDMSLVGPRAKLPHHEGLRLLWRPGITGAATLAFRDEEELLSAIAPENLAEAYETYLKPAKARLDFAYMQSATFVSDCRVLRRTIASCLFPWKRAQFFSGEFLEIPLSRRSLSLTLTRQPRGTFQTGKKMAWLLLLWVILAPIPARAQQSGQTASAQPGLSQWDFFSGYSYWATKGSVTHVPFRGSNRGIDFDGAYYFDRFHRCLGVQLASHYYYNESNNSLLSLSTGPVLRFPAEFGLSPYVHLLAGAADIEGPNVPIVAMEPGGPVHEEFATWGPQLSFGQGLNYNLPLLHHRFAWRVYQIDYAFDHVNYGPGHKADLNSAMLSTGLALHMGSVAAPPIALVCSATPDTVLPGEPVTLAGIATRLDPKRKASYSWSSRDAAVTGSGATLTVDTARFKPGNYLVEGRVTQGSQPRQSATCTTRITVKTLPGSSGTPARKE
jgi:lipopolysaccharide/colanic/teichoic acid biosynthesis glycosyltransferase